MEKAEREKRTFFGYLFTRLLDTPFWGLYNLLPFILYRDLHATPFEIALLVTLKPLSSFFSGLWGSFVYNRPDRLVANIVWARILSVIPYFFFPWMQSPLYFIFAHGFFMMFTVGTVPAWMEILRQNLPDDRRSRLFTGCQAFGYLGGGLLPIITGALLDGYQEAWRLLFPIFASFSLIPILFQKRMIVDSIKEFPRREAFHFRPLIKDAVKVIFERPDFVYFQLAFMAIGGALMLLQPALPVFFVDVLQLSYMELALAITLCKGAGYVVASPFLSKWFRHEKIFYFSSLTALFTSLFPLLLLVSRYDILLVFAAYVIYGAAQAGSEYLWNMSGPLFSRDKDSTLFSFLNILAVGLRGAIVPPLGSLLLVMISPSYVMAISALICLGGGLFFRYCELPASGRSGVALRDP